MDDEYWATVPAAMSTADVARVLRVSELTVLRRLNAAKLPGYKLTKSSWIVFRDELRAVLEAARNLDPREPVVVDVLAELPEELGYRDLMAVFGKTKPTIYAWFNGAVIPAYQLDGRWVVYKHELRAALDAVRNIPRV